MCRNIFNDFVCIVDFNLFQPIVDYRLENTFHVESTKSRNMYIKTIVDIYATDDSRYDTPSKPIGVDLMKTHLR